MGHCVHRGRSPTRRSPGNASARRSWKPRRTNQTKAPLSPRRRAIADSVYREGDARVRGAIRERAEGNRTRDRRGEAFARERTGRGREEVKRLASEREGGAAPREKKKKKKKKMSPSTTCVRRALKMSSKQFALEAVAKAEPSAARDLGASSRRSRVRTRGAPKRPRARVRREVADDGFDAGAVEQAVAMSSRSRRTAPPPPRRRKRSWRSDASRRNASVRWNAPPTPRSTRMSKALERSAGAAAAEAAATSAAPRARALPWR